MTTSDIDNSPIAYTRIAIAAIQPIIAIRLNVNVIPVSRLLGQLVSHIAGISKCIHA